MWLGDRDPSQLNEDYREEERENLVFGIQNNP